MRELIDEAEREFECEDHCWGATRMVVCLCRTCKPDVKSK